MLSSADGKRIMSYHQLRLAAIKDAVDQVENAVNQVDSDLHFQLKHAVEQVDTMFAGSNPRLTCCLEATMEDPRLQKQMASVQKQMEATTSESPSLLEVGQSSGEGAKVEPWKAMAATLLLASNLVPSFAFDVARVK